MTLLLVLVLVAEARIPGFLVLRESKENMEKGKEEKESHKKKKTKALNMLAK